jgi:hypothetical protein
MVGDGSRPLQIEGHPWLVTEYIDFIHIWKEYVCNFVST